MSERMATFQEWDVAMKLEAPFAPHSFHHSGSGDERMDGENVTPQGAHRPTFNELPEAEPLALARERPNRLFCAFLNGWGRFKAWNERFEDSFWGDVIAGFALFVFLMIVIIGLHDHAA